MQFQKSTIPLSLLQKISGGRGGGHVVVPKGDSVESQSVNFDLAENNPDK
ncbi:hypothetical protein [Pseudoalteromonas sp. NJ631]|nr:hypothetical protein [Pseudoalteromonas sp. NJ631]